ncbi:hypothetical protein GGX14DRAFT_471832 [Mycena pura]|uniref:BZIP domain-containing protein n=1 Tax=Mycena pura TaxID=153505 RepID=A0AAD6UXQ0_9AGAR|nr:hypothetical protein GGX14DRAFT_471832 [Mycena pura]
MAPSLQGLNIVHPPHTASSGQDLLSGPPFPDLLWNNLVFEDESPDDKFSHHQSRGADDDLDLDNTPQSPTSLLHLGHVNVVTGTNAPEAPPVQQQHQPFDLNNLLATFAQPPPGISPSIVQLLALHSAVQNAAPSAQQQQQQQRQSPSTDPRSAPFDVPPTKRARTRKASISSAAEAPEDGVAEDKRRRNTAASARFRLKKKEREAALETRAKELESRVNELERECEGLRRENGWLKGLVVGVTGAVQQAPQPTSTSHKRGRDELEAA